MGARQLVQRTREEGEVSARQRKWGLSSLVEDSEHSDDSIDDVSTNNNGVWLRHS